MLDILRRKVLLILKLSQLIEYQIREILMEKFAGSIHQKLVPDPFLILVSSPIKPIHAKKHLKIKYFERGLSKNLSKFNLIFSFWTHSLFMDFIIKNKRGLTLVISVSFGCKTCCENAHYSDLKNFDDLIQIGF